MGGSKIELESHILPRLMPDKRIQIPTGRPKKMVHSDFFTPRTLWQPATIREQLRTHFWVILWIVHPLVPTFVFFLTNKPQKLEDALFRQMLTFYWLLLTFYGLLLTFYRLLLTFYGLQLALYWLATHFYWVLLTLYWLYWLLLAQVWNLNQ